MKAFEVRRFQQGNELSQQLNDAVKTGDLESVQLTYCLIGCIPTTGPLAQSAVRLTVIQALVNSPRGPATLLS